MGDCTLINAMETENESVIAPIEIEGFDFLQATAGNVLTYNYKYFDQVHQRVVELRILTSEALNIPNLIENFKEKLLATSSFNHPNLIEVLHFDDLDPARPYVIVESIEGTPLKEWIQSGSITPESALNIITTVGGVIELFHNHDCFHSGINPSSIYITNDHEIKVDKCNLDSLLDSAQKAQLLGLQVLDYSPPENISSHTPTAAAEVYSLAAVFYEMLSGHAPHGAITPLSKSTKLDYRIDQIILRALSSDPGNRQQTVSELISPLYRIATNTPIVPNAPAPLDIDYKAISGSKLILPIAAVLIISLSIGGYFLWEQYQQKVDSETTPVIAKEEETAPEEAEVDVLSPLISILSVEHGDNRLTLEIGLDNTKVIQKSIDPAGIDYRFENSNGDLIPSSSANNHAFEASVPWKFNLSLDPLNNPPSAIKLLIVNTDGSRELASNLLPIVEETAQYLKELADNKKKATTPVRVEAPNIPATNNPTPPIPYNITNAADLYIYAGHFYQGDEVGLLKLNFGNAGTIAFTGNAIAFQCALSIDDTWHELLPNAPGVMPTYFNDLAVGGFTTKWLGFSSMFIEANKKIWMKHTFRIDTSNEEVMNAANFLLIKINPHQNLIETNHKNNIICIPLEKKNEWVSVTQDPSDNKGDLKEEDK